MENQDPSDEPRGAYAFLDIEQRRLREGLHGDEVPQGLCIDAFVVDCGIEPAALIARAKELLLCVNEQSESGKWPSDDEWKALLPDWFVAASGPDETREQALRNQVRFRAMSHEERVAYIRTDRWPVRNWVHLMKPDRRLWLWWDAYPMDERTAMVGIDRLIIPDPELPDEFVWMLRACGAADVDSYDYQGEDPFPY